MSVIICLQMVKNAKKFGPKNWEFLENFWSFMEFLEWFGVFLGRSGVGGNFDIHVWMSRIAQENT